MVSVILLMNAPINEFATAKAVLSGRFPATCLSFVLSIKTTESQVSQRAIIAFLAYSRLSDSISKGIVRQAIVSAPMECEISATTGTEPVPVPPPRPATIKTIFASPSSSCISFALSRAHSAPTSGNPPHPLPLLRSFPMSNNLSAFWRIRWLISEFAAMVFAPAMFFS